MKTIVDINYFTKNGILKLEKKYTFNSAINNLCLKFIEHKGPNQFKYKDSCNNILDIVSIYNLKIIDNNLYLYYSAIRHTNLGLSDQDPIYIEPSYTWRNYINPELNTFDSSASYCSSNYTLLTAISMSQQSLKLSYENKMWYDPSLACQYYLKTSNPNIIGNTAGIYFPTIQTIQYAHSHWNFISSSYYYDDEQSLLKYNNYFSLNQGLGCGNAIASTESMANMFIHVLSGDISGISSTFINKYMLFRDPPREISNNIDNILGYPYSAGIMNLDSDIVGMGQNKLKYPCIGHYGESYGVSTILLGNTSIDATYYVSLASAINLELPATENPAYQMAILRIFYIFLINKEGPTTNYLDNLLRSIKIKASNLSKIKDIYLSISYIIYNIKDKSSQKTSLFYNYIDSSWNNRSSKNLKYTYNWGSCGSKLMTALNTIIMVNSLSLFQLSDTELWKKLGTYTTLSLLTNTVQDYRLEDRDIPILKEQLMTPTSIQKSIGFKDSYNITFLNPTSSKEYKNLTPATNYNSLTLKRLLYMNSNLNDFDKDQALIGPSEKCPPSGAEQCPCFIGDTIFVVIDSIWGQYPYGPFQWLQMANRCSWTDKNPSPISPTTPTPAPGTPTPAPASPTPSSPTPAVCGTCKTCLASNQVCYPDETKQDCQAHSDWTWCGS